ncbi:c-type cytochrome [Deinococcus aluminii]|uniref:Cytochrome c oxidase subunit 2 n=1 Tax=Deinococcus aluminii TaxID=1656885 RepID=A0ABP9XFP6_9DEIO
MMNVVPWLLSVLFGLLWWRRRQADRRLRREREVHVVPPLPEVPPPQVVTRAVAVLLAAPAALHEQPLQTVPQEDPNLDIEAAEPGAEHLAPRRRWMGFGAGVLVAFIVVVLLAASYNRIPVTPAPWNQSGDIAADGPSALNVLAGADPARAPALFRSYGCVSCHVIPGVSGAEGRVGPNLKYLGDHALIAGVLPNTPENLMRWIRIPQTIDPYTGMPTLGVTERDARDIAAYLRSVQSNP